MIRLTVEDGARIAAQVAEEGLTGLRYYFGNWTMIPWPAHAGCNPVMWVVSGPM